MTCLRSGPPLLQVLDELPLPKRDPKAPLRIPILDKLKDSGKLIIQGKVESGTIYLGQKVAIMPGKVRFCFFSIFGVRMVVINFFGSCLQKAGKVISLATDLKEIRRAGPGENVRFTLSAITEDHVRTGFVVCDEGAPILAVPQFEAQIAILDLLPHKVHPTFVFRSPLLLTNDDFCHSLSFHLAIKQCSIVTHLWKNAPSR